MTTAGVPVDTLYCHMGTVRFETSPYAPNPWIVEYRELPKKLPPAREYWLVFRSDYRGVPSSQVVPEITRYVVEIQAEARQRGLTVAGIQFDIDSPTGALPQYAEFLKTIRRSLAPGLQVSITCLLDWFRNGTAIGEVLKEADEFVPQFYDVQEAGNAAIAKRIDASKWGPVFNRYGRRFRIGISSFGRSRLVPKEEPRGHYLGVALMEDLKPLDVATNSAFKLETSRTEANEVVLSYRATRSTRIGRTEFSSGDTFQFILPTQDAIARAAQQAKSMGKHCAGVLFFRWPEFNEDTALQPSEVLRAAGLLSQVQANLPVLRTSDGDCAAVHCVDLYLINENPFSPNAVRYLVRSSTELEYFIPAERMPIRMSGPADMELSLPPYCLGSHMYLGRAVTAKRADFRIEEEK